MSDWTAGYVADIGYTYGYYNELNPLRSELLFLNAGIVPPPNGTHCELGFGQGMSVNIHAAATGATWYATDFNPSQAAFAKSLAEESGADAHLFDEAFADFCTREELPDFDSIGLHGIWSWISDENRAVIVDFVRRKLKVGGVVYISYNTQPGWAAMAPFRDLLTEHASVMGVSGKGIVNRIDEALAFADQLMAANPLYARANPSVSERLNGLKGQNRHYLAHEYFNRDWLPMSFSRLAEWLAPAKVDYACSATYLDHLDAINVSVEQQAILNAIPDKMFRESVRDFCVNQQFRRDYWIKGARKLHALERIEAIRAYALVLISEPSSIKMKATGALGEADLQEQVYRPFIEALADYQPKTLGELEQLFAGQLTLSQLVQAAIVLTGNGVLQPAQSAETIAKMRDTTARLNAALIEKARDNGEMSYLVSPVTGGGITVSRFELLFLRAYRQGHTSPEAWANEVWEILKSLGQRLLKDGKPLQTDAENLADLTAQATAFGQKLPLFEALQL